MKSLLNLKDGTLPPAKRQKINPSNPVISMSPEGSKVTDLGGVSNDGANGSGVDALNLLPEVVWREVVQKFDSPDDCYACFQTCQTFERLLWTKRTTFLFPKVLPMLEAGFTKEELKSSYVASRQVCLTWKQALDRHCEKMSFESYTFKSEDDLGEALTYKFYKARQLLEFSQKMLQRPERLTNPFFSRRVMFTRNREDFEADLEEHAVERDRGFAHAGIWFMAHFGMYIWRFELVAERSHPSTITYLYLLFADWMPNVRSISVISGRRGLVTERSRRRLKELVELAPLPRLQDLSQIEVNNADNIVTEALVNSCDVRKVTKLRITSVDANVNVELAARFTNLKALSLSLHREPGLFTSLKTVWPLTVLKLDVRLSKWFRSREPIAGRVLLPEGAITFSSLFNWINKFGPTLTSLQLNLRGRSYYRCTGTNMDAGLRLALPVLTELEISGGENQHIGISSLEFVRNLQQLERLTIEVHHFIKTVDRMERIRFCGYASRMGDSNVWGLLPALRTLSLKERNARYKYTRPVAVREESQ